MHDNLLLSPKQKLLYLLTHLKCAAYEKVSLLPVVDKNNDLALSTLTKWYHNAQLAAQSYCHNLLYLPIVSICSVAAMQEFVDSFHLSHVS